MKTLLHLTAMLCIVTTAAAAEIPAENQQPAAPTAYADAVASATTLEPGARGPVIHL
jgi:hypothetical protein